MTAPPALAGAVPLQPKPAAPPVEQRPHPRGAAGVRAAMEWMRSRIVEDARHPRVIEWTRQTIRAAGLPDRRGYPVPDHVAGAIAERLERDTTFVKDPLDTEAVGSTVQVLSLDPEDLELSGGDCEELVRALASCWLAAGIPVRLVCRFYASQGLAHIVAEYDADPAMRGHWTCRDPSVEGGACSTARYQGEIVMEVVMGTLDQPGTFVGMGGPMGDMGDPPTSLSAGDVAGVVSDVQYVQEQLQASISDLQQTISAYTTWRQQMGLPQYDAAASTGTSSGSGTSAAGGGGGASSSGETTGTTAGPLATYASGHLYTSDVASAQTQLVATGTFVLQCLSDALSGARAMYWQSAASGTGGDVLIASQSGDPYRLAFVADSSGNQTIQYLDASGNSTGTMGIVQAIVIGAVVAVVALSVAWAIHSYCDQQKQAMEDDVQGRVGSLLQQNVASGKETPAQAQEFAAAMATWRASAPPTVSVGLPAAASTAAMFGVGVVGLIAGGLLVYFVAPRVFPSIVRAAA